jgi:PKHD-type hydroxylase
MILYDFYSLPNLYNEEECRQIASICESNRSNILKDSPAPNKKAKTHVTDTDLFGDLLKKYFKYTHEINRNFFGFDLFQDPPLGINYNVYSGTDNEYPYHRDCNTPGSSSDSKLTAILNISDNSYKGGEFFMFFGHDLLIEEINRPGTLLVFPSFVFHKVSPVTEGCRKTISTWCQGPAFK